MRVGIIRTVTGQPRPLYHDELAEFLSLAAEIQAAEGLDVDTALDRAAEQLDELAHYYPYMWDSTALTAGNWDAMAGAIPF